MTCPSMAQLLQPKQQLAGYEIDELVGKGGMGEVYRARQMSMDRVVALKILAPRLVKQDPIFAKRFVEEARAAGRLNHPNIIAVHDVGKAPMPGAVAGDLDLDYFSMEFVDGESVKDVIERQEFCPLSVVAQVIQGMTEAMVYAEAQGIVHRDIKPDNIMITNGGVVKLADLGLALQLGDEEIITEKDEHGRGKVMGTPLYMSPEQARALPVDARSDQYSLGATLFHMLTGKPPFKGENAKMIMRSHVFDPVPDPKDINHDVPETWRHLCMRLMAKTPEERFSDAVAMRVAVQAAISGHPGISRRVRTAGWSAAGQAARGMPSWAKYLVYGFAAVVVLMVIGFSIPWVGSSKEVKSPDILLTDQVAAAKAAAAQEAQEAQKAQKAQKIVERVNHEISGLPADHQQAIAALDKLAEDKAIPPGPARSLIESEKQSRLRQLADEKAALLTEKNRQRQEHSLALDKAWSEKDLVRVKACILYLTPEADKLSPTARAALNTISKNFTVALVDLQKIFKEELMSATKVEEVKNIRTRVAASALLEETKTNIYEYADKRLNELSPIVKAPKATADDRALWLAFNTKLDEFRGGKNYGEISRLAEKEAANFSNAEAQAMVKSIGQLGRLAAKAEGGLRVYIAEVNPTEEITFEGKSMKAKLLLIDDKINFVVPAGEKREDRKNVVLPLRKMLNKAYEDSPDSTEDRTAMIAAMLWVWRMPDAAEVFAAIPDSPLTKAVQEFDRKTRVLDVRARAVRTGNQVTITYDGKDSPWFLDDFVGEGVRIGPKGLTWSTNLKVNLKGKEKDIPTLKWKQSLRPPFTLSGQFVLADKTFLLLVGVSSGEKIVRIGLNNTDPKNPCVIFVTKDNNSGFYLENTGNWSGKLNKVGVPQNIEITVDSEYRATLSCNGVMVLDKPFSYSLPPYNPLSIQLPLGESLSPLMQLMQVDGGPASSVEVQSLAITGVATPAE